MDEDALAPDGMRSAPVPDSAPAELPIAFGVFAATLRPRRVPMLRNGAPVTFKGRVVMTVTYGHGDEIWLKLLKINHGGEKHTPTEWSALIAAYGSQPAYPGMPGVT
jgi:hypothetical protein